QENGFLDRKPHLGCLLPGEPADSTMLALRVRADDRLAVGHDQEPHIVGAEQAVHVLTVRAPVARPVKAGRRSECWGHPGLPLDGLRRADARATAALAAVWHTLPFLASR